MWFDIYKRFDQLFYVDSDWKSCETVYIYKPASITQILHDNNHRIRVAKTVNFRYRNSRWRLGRNHLVSSTFHLMNQRHHLATNPFVFFTIRACNSAIQIFDLKTFINFRLPSGPHRELNIFVNNAKFGDLTITTLGKVSSGWSQVNFDLKYF